MVSHPLPRLLITLHAASLLSRALRIHPSGSNSVLSSIRRLLLFSDSGIPWRQDSGPAHLPEVTTCGHPRAWWVPLGSDCHKSSVARRDGTECGSLDPPDISCAGRALLVSKRPCSGPAVRGPVVPAPPWRPCCSCPAPLLAVLGFRESPSVPCVESVGMHSQSVWACGSTGLTEGSVGSVLGLVPIWAS